MPPRSALTPVEGGGEEREREQKRREEGGFTSSSHSPSEPLVVEFGHQEQVRPASLYGSHGCERLREREGEEEGDVGPKHLRVVWRVVWLLPIHVKEVWKAHKVAVQAVIKLPSGEIVTGSSDTTLKLWRGRTCLHTFMGHTDTVRGLAVLPGLGILSASHDCSIKLWASTGQVLMEMTDHSSLVYSVDAHSSGLVASGSEDCFLKIWKDGVCVQSIEHPGCVWDAKFLENGDIITACSDGTVRIWTLDNDWICDPQELEAYGVELSLYKSSRKKVGGLKLTDLPGLEALQVPGTTDGQTKVIREGDNGVAYSWNSREHRWDKIGEAVDGPGEA